MSHLGTFGIVISILALGASTVVAEDISFDGFMQALYGVRVDQSNPTVTEMTASESRLQLRIEHFGDDAEFFGRLDFIHDAADSIRYDWELREGYFKFHAGSKLDFKIGRQILTWGTGDLIFINDLFAKDYRSFFVGRDDQYLKAPQTAIRIEYYSDPADITFVWTPRFEPNRLPSGRRLSFYDPMEGAIVGGYLPSVDTPQPKFENGEFALKFNRQISGWNSSVYLYKGFYKNPIGAVMDGASALPLYPRLNAYGGSIRGIAAGGILWLEGGYFDSRQDNKGVNPLMPNSTINGLVGFERQAATDLTANIQWQIVYMLDYDNFLALLPAGSYVQKEVKHLLTSRVTRMLNDELITLSGFLFYSPTDKDSYLRLSGTYKYTDEITISLGGNLFDGKNPATEFGQFRKNDNLFVKLTYGF